MKQVLIVDDEKDIRMLLGISLEREGFMPILAEDVANAKSKILNDTFVLALTDLRLPDGSGMEIVKFFKQHHPDTPIAVMTAYDTTDVAVEAMRSGAFDFIPKPIRQERLHSLVRDAIPNEESSYPPDIESSQGAIVGNTHAIQELRTLIKRVAQTQAPVMITGESGTGKELAANSIHQQGNRSDRPFIAVNCGAIPAELMESEFFGHVKGSFTGASANKQGLFQAADGGTLFLDEIADLPMNMQVKLLRAVQEKAVRPVGANEEILVNVRILSATHKNLLDEIDKDNFRQDLYYRLNVIELRIPSLRERTDDIPVLCSRILAKLKQESGSGNGDYQITEAAMSVLKSFPFKGNVRELENILHRGTAVCDSHLIDVKHLNLNSSNGTADSKTKDLYAITDIEEHLRREEQKILEAALHQEKWNKNKTATRLNLSLRQLRYKLSKHGLLDDL